MRTPTRVISALFALSCLTSSPALAGGDGDHPRRGLTIGGEFENWDFSDKNLAGAVFIGANFQGATFADSELPGVTIVESRFNDTDFSDVDMPGSRLTGVTFSRARLDGARMHPRAVRRLIERGRARGAALGLDAIP